MSTYGFQIQHTVPYLRESQGRIIFTSSGAAESGTTSWGPYGASKAALNHLAKTLAREEKCITTVAIRPGMVDTGMQELIRGEEFKSMDEEDRLKFINAHKDGKLLPPDKPGHVMARLAVSASEELSGQFITWSDEKLAAYQDK
jgi:NAD(P)-dependent dehydrogenase (short-subunit alcohol dehydrogenase family)